MGSIRVSHLGKAYKQYPNQWARLAEWLAPDWIGGARPRHHLKWVMQDVTFSLAPGEAVGIIGINGAGKSTLLKMITGTTQPTTGSVQITGRVAALLELGMGFHPEFSGRQNVFMAGQLLGLSSEEIAGLMPQIAAFSEIGDYLDQPVRTYSSGMQMRLAFSVATASRPDVLIVDEAMSVGDAYFQHKSFERIRAFRQAGTTLLIVSHDKGAIQSICDRALLLSAGRVALEGAPEEVMDYYNAMLAERENVDAATARQAAPRLAAGGAEAIVVDGKDGMQRAVSADSADADECGAGAATAVNSGSTVRQIRRDDGKVQTISGTGEASVTDVRLLGASGQAQEVFDVGVPVSLLVTVVCHAPIPRLVLGYMIKDRLGQAMYGTNTDIKRKVLNDVQPGETIEYRFDFRLGLGPGTYSIATALVSTDTHLVNNYEWRDLALVFTVANLTHEHFVGCAWIDPVIHTNRPRVGATIAS